jgi:hypothetical protein
MKQVSLYVLGACCLPLGIYVLKRSFGFPRDEVGRGTLVTAFILIGLHVLTLIPLYHSSLLFPLYSSHVGSEQKQLRGLTRDHFLSLERTDETVETDSCLTVSSPAYVSCFTVSSRAYVS